MKWISRIFWGLTILGLICITGVIMYLSKEVPFIQFINQNTAVVIKVVCGIALLAASGQASEKLQNYVNTDPRERRTLTMFTLVCFWLLSASAYIWLTFIGGQPNFLIILGTTAVALIFIIGLFMRLTD